MWNYHRGWGRGPFLACATLLVTVAAPAAVRAQEPTSAIVVIDGSGSMGAILEGTRTGKVVLARDAVRRGLAKLGPQTRVGLVAFGHRRGDCGDVELMRPLETLDVQRFADTLERMNPRGRGPLTAALREAAKSLPPGPGKRSLILIHDDADNCQQNVCAAAEELRRAGIVAHVVGLGLKPPDAGAMVCLPQVTGGRMFNARTPEQVVANVEEALRLAGSEAAGVNSPASSAPAQQTPALGAAAVPADGPPGLYLRALLAAAAEPVNLPLRWTVFTEGKPETVLFAARVANPFVALPRGRYVAEVRDGPVSASQTIDVGDKGPTVANLVLNAGILQIRAQAQKSGVALGDAIVAVSDGSEADRAAEGKKESTAPPIAMFRGSEGILMLPAGRYLVRVEQGLVRAERSVIVPAGTQGRIDVPLNAARLLVSASGQDSGASAEGVVFSVVEDDPDAPKGRREVARSAARQADFVVPPGTYYVVARQGSVEARERLAVGPGDVVRRTLNVAAGRLALATKPVGAVVGPAELVSYRVERLDSAPPEVIATSRAAPVLALPGGRYRVEGRYGAMNVRTVRDVEIKVGQTQQLTLEHQAAALKLRLVSNGAPVLAEVLWDIRDEAGTTVWTTGQPEPSATLQAGRYSVRAETRDKRYDRVIDLRAGEQRLIELTAD
jgi:Ca-activated chloride channel family protein